MKLYYVVGSPNCRKVHAVLNHLSITAELVYLDFFVGEHKQADYLAYNANGKVPTLIDGDFALWESNAIMQYLADQGSTNTLFPRDQKLRADVARWQSWELAHYNKALGVLSFETVAKPNFLRMTPDEAKVKLAKEDLALYAPVLDAHMRGRHFAVSNSITLADYSLIHLEGFKDHVPFDWTPYPNLNAYYERMRKVPHWANTAPPSVDAIGRRPHQAALRADVDSAVN